MNAAAQALATARAIQRDADAIVRGEPIDTSPALVTADALPEGFDAMATLDALSFSAVPLRGAEEEDYARVRRYLYLRALVSAAGDEIDGLKDRVLHLVLGEDGERATIAGSDLAVTWRPVYQMPDDVLAAEDEVKRLKKYHSTEANRTGSTAVLSVRASRAPRP